MTKAAVEIVIDDKQESFSHKDDEGKLRIFLIGTMQKFLVDYGRACSDIQAQTVVITDALYKSVLEFNGIERARVNRLTAPYLLTPGMGIEWPNGEYTVIDGNHRLVRLYEDGVRRMRFIGFKYPFWEQFLVADDVAQDMAAAKELFNCDSGMLAFDQERMKR